MSFYRILELHFGEKQCYRHRERGSSWGGTNRTFSHKKNSHLHLFSSLSHLWGFSRCHVPVAGTYLPAVSVCVSESAWCEHRQRFPGGGGAALECQFSLPPNACAVLILTPAKCQHWFLESSADLRYQQTCNVSAAPWSQGRGNKVKTTI